MSDTAFPEEIPANAVAVVGMAARLPGARTVTAFWDNLRRGEESIVDLTDNDLLAAGVTEETIGNPLYVRRAPLVEGIDEFDAEFFGFPPQTARMMDPQHRMFLQCAWHAMEDAGVDPADHDGSIGVFATSGSSIYLMHNLLSHHDPNTMLGQGATFDLINLSLLNDKDYLATRVSHQFNLRGPSMTVQTACSSSMVAIHSACQSLLSGECDMVLAGGVSLRVPHRVGYWHEPGSMVSPFGHCRPFDSRADGTVFGSGAAVVVLKPLQKAIDDGDRIHAVIRGSAINNDGSMKMTYAAPNGAAQADVIAEAHAVADIDASTISYVEAHGTGTPLGDPIEIGGLRKAFSLSTAARPGPCAVGSVKSNIGHLAEVSGIAGLIKTILCLKNRAIPATLHYAEPNPALDLDRGPFYIPNEYTPWEWDGVRRAGVSSFGVGGTNVHLVVEEAPQAPAAPGAPGPRVLRLSARSSESISIYRDTLAEELARPDTVDLDDVAYTLDCRRREPVRLAALVRDQADAVAVLRATDSDDVAAGERVDGADAGVVVMFPGQGAQHADMAHGLYDNEPVFAAAFDECVAGFDAELGIDLRGEIFGAQPDLERTDRAQPALFTVEYALGRLLEAYGVRAAAYAGHSIGEYAAATLAGVFDLPTAIAVVAQRARLMHASPPGSMVAVSGSPADIADLLGGGLDVAAINDAGGFVVSGSQEDIKKLQNDLRWRQILTRRVRTAHAFHSRLMDAVVPQFADFLSRVELRAPRIPLLSNVTGTWLTDAEATDPQFWASQIRATVRFADELGEVLAGPHRVLVEAGPGGTLSGSAIRHPRWTDGHRAIRLMRHQVQNRADHDTFLLALGQLWIAGVDVDWAPKSDRRPRRLTLPGYPFARQRHWIEPNRDLGWSAGGAAADGSARHDSPTADRASGDAEQSIEQKLQAVWRECLGVGAVDPAANFFEIGGDSLIAIGVAMNATNRGIDLTPQDLYEYPTVAALATAITARYAAGGLTDAANLAEVDPPVPATVAHAVEHGVRDAGRWRIPLVLRITPEVTVADVQAVLTAVTNHHDALRVGIVERAGGTEQRIAAPVDSVELAELSLPTPTETGHDTDLTSVIELLVRQPSDGSSSAPPIRAAYLRDGEGNGRFVVIDLLATLIDAASRDIVLADLATAFGKRLTDQEIILTPVSATWREWSHRCTGLVTHPAVLDSRDYWLETITRTTMHLADHQVTDPPRTHDMVRLGTTLSEVDTEDLDRARRMFQYTVQELLLAALSRAVGDTVGEGVLQVSLEGDGRSVLKPEVDARRTVGAFTALYPAALTCVRSETSRADQLLDEIHQQVQSVPHQGISHGLLRYLYGPTARAFSAVPPPDLYLSDAGVAPEFDLADSPVRLDADAAMPLRDTVSGTGHAIELRLFRSAGRLHLDWWYDTRRVAQGTVEGLAARLPVALRQLIAEATVPGGDSTELAGPMEELGLVDITAE
ncbi:acyltransferase domain-containing protein [Mycobacterium sp. PS03-16]|uniref:type I polyketide synthase n=1 Tax=Mycobacterium sp. PS03-16 TaxID=2559611 RepID=UPI00107313D6|nr:type I polyketide synthase [Mycobacterium sp. PS03-16]TFV57980.1 acyltransferase domain-containing protein [Mycobacterium sp. PS03-16]